MLTADLEALRRQEIARHPAACERILEMQLIHPSHDGKVGVRDGPRPVIDASPADAQHLCLARDRQIVGTVYHRFALSRPALPSAPSKKSFSSVSSPIFAWSDLISTRGTSGSERVSDPNTAAAPSWSSDFHCVIWLGWTSNCCAKSASVFSPLMAASATFALKAAVWFRRGRLLIISPVQQPSWLSSGRSPTYPTAQILQATSILRSGATRAEVARAIGLSPSRISAMFKGQSFPTRKALAEKKAMEAKYSIPYIGWDD